MSPKKFKISPLKINLGCGRDHFPDHLNIDGDESTSPDLVIILGQDPLTNHFGPDSVDHVLAQDVIEHLHHWEAITVLKEIFAILKPEGTLQARMPDAETIIHSTAPLRKKLELLFGGQDTPVDDDQSKNQSRRLHPEFFCHRFGWSPSMFHMELRKIGFSNMEWIRQWPNFTSTATKPSPKTQAR